MAPYSYVKNDGSVANVDAENADAAISSATDRDPASGVVTPAIKSPYTEEKTDRINGKSQVEGIPDAPTARTTPSSRVDPSSFDTPSFGEYRSQKELDGTELSTISNQYSDQLRREMDLINAQFAQKTKGQEDINASQIKRAKVLNANNGLIDSGTGFTAIADTEKKGKAATDAIQNEKFATLQKVTGDIDDLKMNAIKAATAEKANDLVSYNNVRNENATKAQDIIKNYIAAGGDIEKLKLDKNNPNDPNEESAYDALSKAVGGEGFLKAYAVANAPKDQYVSDKPEIIGNTAIWFKKNNDGTISKVSVDLPEDASKSPVKSVIRSPGEGIFVIHEDGTYQSLGNGGVVGKGTGGTTTPKGTTYTSGTLTIPKSDISEGVQRLDAIRGADKYVDPYKYLDMYNIWVKGGGLPNDFKKNYPPTDYINPDANPILPPGLRVPTKKGTSGGA